MDTDLSTSLNESDLAIFSLLASNPWNKDGDHVTILRNFLIKVNQLGFDTQKNQIEAVQKLKSLESIKIISQQKDISSKHKELLKAKQFIKKHNEEKDVAELLHLDVIEEKINVIKQLSNDIDTVLQNTELLINRLQKPFVGTYIKIDSAYHRHTCELFTQLVPTLNDLTLHLENITWMAKNDFVPTKLEPLLLEVQSRGASLQTTYHTLTQMMIGMQKLSQDSESFDSLCPLSPKKPL